MYVLEWRMICQQIKSDLRDRFHIGVVNLLRHRRIRVTHAAPVWIFFRQRDTRAHTGGVAM